MHAASIKAAGKLIGCWTRMWSSWLSSPGDPGDLHRQLSHSHPVVRAAWVIMDSSSARQCLPADRQQTLEDCDSDSETQDFQACAHLVREREDNSTVTASCYHFCFSVTNNTASVYPVLHFVKCEDVTFMTRGYHLQMKTKRDLIMLSKKFMKKVTLFKRILIRLWFNITFSCRRHSSTKPAKLIPLSHPHLFRAIVTVAPGWISWLAATAASARDATACVASEAWVVWIVISPPWRVAQFCSTWRGIMHFHTKSEHGSAVWKSLILDCLSSS